MGIAHIKDGVSRLHQHGKRRISGADNKLEEERQC
jgi:hypothetical protein